MARFAGDYSPDQYIISVGAPVGPLGLDFTPALLALGVVPSGFSFPFTLTGAAPGTFISTARAVPVATMEVGADGEVTRSRSLNRTGTITWTAKHSAIANTVLSAYLIAFEAGINLTFPLSIVDINAAPQTAHSGPDTWLQGWPSDERAETDGSFVWVFDTANLNIFLGSRAR